MLSCLKPLGGLVPPITALLRQAGVTKDKAADYDAAVAVIISFIMLCCICSSRLIPAAAGAATPTTAVVPLERPKTEPLVVPLLQQARFQNGYAPYIVTVDLPEGNWAQIILDWTGSVKGVQYDRFYTFWVGDCQILRGTTPEPTAEGITWHVEKDVTEYASALRGTKRITVYLPNWVTSDYTGVYAIDATLSFYPDDDDHPPAVTLDTIVAITDNPLIPDDLRFTQAASRQGRRITIPHGVYGATLQLYSTPHAADEFWWTQADAWREIRVYLDDLLVGVVWPTPYIYTGGINPRLWWGLPAVSTWNIMPYELDLTPFLGLLSGERNLEIEFIGIQDHWLTSAMLLLKTSPQPITGNIERHDLTPMQTMPDGAKQRTFTVKGYIDTTEGRIDHELVQLLSFKRTQTIDSTGTKQIHQESATHTTLTVRTAQSSGTAAGEGETVTHHVDNKQSYVLVAELPQKTASGQAANMRKTVVRLALERERLALSTHNDVITAQATSFYQDQVHSQVTEAWLG
jgi:hypothetical protein